MQIPILQGAYTAAAPDIRTALPRNLVPVPHASGISQGYLKSAEGITDFADGPGPDRGGIAWNGVMYRVMGTSLVSVAEDSTVLILGDVGFGGPVTLDYSFERLVIASGGRLYYWTQAGGVVQVTDPDLGTAVDAQHVAGYTMTTDGTYLVVTELNDPMAVLPTKYGSSEADPDPVVAIKRVRGEVVALNRFSVETFQNVGGTGFPFARIDGAEVSRGCIGTHACCPYLDSIAFVGGGRNEPPSVWLLGSGSAARIATREIDTILQEYSEADLAACVVEARADRGHQHLLIHLPDQTLVYDHAATQALGVGPVWFTLSSGVGRAPYLGRGLVWCYGKWLCGHPFEDFVGELVETSDEHFGQAVGWEFATTVLYIKGGAIVHELELAALTGRAMLGANPVVSTSYSADGRTWSQEKTKRVGQRGQTDKRICWLQQGQIRQWRIQRFRGAGTGPVAFARLEARIEPLAA